MLMQSPITGVWKAMCGGWGEEVGAHKRLWNSKVWRWPLWGWDNRFICSWAGKLTKMQCAKTVGVWGREHCPQPAFGDVWGCVKKNVLFCHPKYLSEDQSGRGLDFSEGAPRWLASVTERGPSNIYFNSHQEVKNLGIFHLVQSPE